MRPRNRELVLLILVAVGVISATATLSIAHAEHLDAAALLWGGIFMAIAFGVHAAIRRFTPDADPFLLPAMTLLSGLGLTMIARLKPDLAGRQAVWLLLSAALLVGLLIALRPASVEHEHTNGEAAPQRYPDHRRLESKIYLIGTAAVLALLVTISPLGHEVNGAQLWINFGVFQVQPGEFAKLGMVIFLAGYLSVHRERLSVTLSIRELGRRDTWNRLLGLKELLLFWAASIVLLVLMNDFGTSLLFYGGFLMMLYVATARLWYVITGAAAFAAASVAVYSAAAHVQQRFDVWLDPWKDPQGTGYQLIQGLFAMADGGFTGRGIGQAYLVTNSGQTLIPFAHTDFIFAAVADETGFIGAVGVLLLYVVIAWRGFAAAARSRDGFSKLLAFGLSTIFALQAIIIVGGVVRLLPLTGQTLPFMSYGGSSVLANFLLVGLLIIISHHAGDTPHPRPKGARP